MNAEAWARRVERARRGLDPVRVLLGRWVGEGQAHGEPVTATLEVTERLDGTYVEVVETVGDHADASVYRYDPDAGQLLVLHLLPGAVVHEHPVEVYIEGLTWVTPPGQPSVLLTLKGTVLHSEVVWPGQRVAEVELWYRREA